MREQQHNRGHDSQSHQLPREGSSSAQLNSRYLSTSNPARRPAKHMARARKMWVMMPPLQHLLLPGREPEGSNLPLGLVPHSSSPGVRDLLSLLTSLSHGFISINPFHPDHSGCTSPANISSPAWSLSSQNCLNLTPACPGTLLCYFFPHST